MGRLWSGKSSRVKHSTASPAAPETLCAGQQTSAACPNAPLFRGPTSRTANPRLLLSSQTLADRFVAFIEQKQRRCANEDTRWLVWQGAGPSYGDQLFSLASTFSWVRS